MSTRAYESPLRAEQSSRTREKILAAFAEQLAEAGEDFSIPKVAERAGVSTRTVYHHFPNREAQIDALAAWMNERAAPNEALPHALDDLPAYAADRVTDFFANEDVLRAQLASGIAERVRARRRARREAAIQACVTQAGVRGADGKIAAALLKHLIGARVAVSLVDHEGLSRAETKRCMRWAVELVVAAIARGETPSSPRD